MTQQSEESTPGHLLIVGTGEVSTALAAVAAALGWQAQVVDSEAEASAAVGRLRSRDSVAVLSHHDGIDGPALAAALASEAGYIGAMGSRRTQARRAQWLRDNGVSDALIDSIRGPAGLDIGADTPGEIAVSIVAEIVAVHRGSGSNAALSARSGPIHPGLAAGTAQCPAG
ncbi:MAG: XdhC family protein [Jatrophihabitantaceae bacterium]